MNKISICGLKIDNVTSDEVINLINPLNCDKCIITTPNVDHIVKCSKDAEFRRIHNEAYLVLPDGMPILWAAKFLGTPLKEKISGSDLLPRICKNASRKGYKLFFLGGRPGAAHKAAEVLRTKYPGIKIVGVYCPYFGFENDENENKKIIDLIKTAQPDILFVGLGAPKQEKWMDRYKNQYHVPISIGVGVSFEFEAGMVVRAPYWMQRFGLEWFWRLMMEPKRLWKRYLVDDMLFFGLVFRQKFL